jgi:leucyl aminopeptidase (aminopeptidase T)
LEVSKGMIENIEGHDAKRFKHWLDSFVDPNMYRMSHFGIGLNHDFTKFTGLKSVHERIYGVVGTGIGTNDIPVFESKIRAKGHTDGYMKSASVYLDGIPFIENRKFTHPGLKST